MIGVNANGFISFIKNYGKQKEWNCNRVWYYFKY
jgi:hypothetical protein